MARALPLERGRNIGRLLGSLAWHLVRHERNKALRNIARAFPDWPDSRRRDTVREMFRHLGQNLMEMLWLLHAPVGERMRYTVVENAAPLLEVIRAGRGIVAFTGHCGNWEWTAATVSALGIPLWAMQRERDERELNDFIIEYRRRIGIGTIDRGSERSGRELIRTLRNGGMIGMLIDQNIRAESAKVPFFGIPALTPIGPARLAIRTGSPVVAVFSMRRDGKHHVRFTDPIETTRDDDPVALTARI
ncbi:MAG TPA: hypothetical protein VNL91_08685, partial [Thermoanaerobaculia bacterium]|nr:hypothetical protein [Thermoanaerobaculia bacterium]